VFDQVKRRWGGYSSWAVWRRPQPGEQATARVGDVSVLNPDENPNLLGMLNPNVVMVGLNASSRAMVPQPWSNFHDPRPVAKDFKIRHAFDQTPWWGAYMTDLVKDVHETDSHQVIRLLTANPAVLATQAARLRRELADIGATAPLLLTFGAAAHTLIVKAFGSQFQIVKLRHYSDYSSQDTYRRQVLDVLTGPVPAGPDRGPFYHGTKADLAVGAMLTAGHHSNYRSDVVMRHVYFTAQVGDAALAAELAAGDGLPRVYLVTPTGVFEDDPNVTDKKFPGNPTRSYRSAAPVQVVGEVVDWPRLSTTDLRAWRDRLAAIRFDPAAQIIN